jgi:rRNA pseudouridine-1189 N-methylase Emg1 (Nep1/Mra1 family)
LLEKHNKLISLYETKLNDLLNKNTEKTEELNPEECILNNKNFKKEYDEL